MVSMAAVTHHGVIDPGAASCANTINDPPPPPDEKLLMSSVSSDTGLKLTIFRGLCVYDGRTTGFVSSFLGLQKAVGTVASLVAGISLSVLLAVNSSDLVENSLSDQDKSWRLQYARWNVNLSMFAYFCSLTSIITALYIAAILVAVNLQQDDTAGLLLWVKLHWWIIAVQVTSLLASIFLALFSIYYCTKLRYPSVVVNDNLFLRISAYLYVGLWIVMLLYVLHVHYRKMLPLATCRRHQEISAASKEVVVNTDDDD